ncbi:MAG: hypothetical protein AAB390_01665 [Patescibacteria group bacterium]
MIDDEIQNAKDGEMEAVPWHKKLLFRIAPMLVMKMEARHLRIDSRKFELAEKLFGDAERIDVRPLAGVDGRGFIVTIDNGLSLFFCQDGDRFIYDGYEIGEYEDGNVTVFDSLKTN